jgi:hypothetical protein
MKNSANKNRKKTTILKSLYDIEKYFFPEYHKRRLEEEKFKNQNFYGLAPAAEFLSEVKQTVSK